MELTETIMTAAWGSEELLDAVEALIDQDGLAAADVALGERERMQNETERV